MLQTQLLSTSLIGRQAELSALVERVEQARTGRGSTVLVAGDAGIGKSRLIREVRARAVARDVRVIEGRCSPAESAIPYGPFMDALRFRIARGEGQEAAEVLAPVLAHVAPLFSELSSIAGERVRQPPAAVHAPFEPIFQVIRRLAQLGPVLLVLEDVHWADSTSRDLIHYLARRLHSEPVLMLVSYRTDELHPGHPVHRLVATLARERVAERIELEPLSSAEVREMIAAILDVEPEPALVRAIEERTEGNPLFIEELLSALAQERPDKLPWFEPEDVAQAAPPATIHEIVLARVEPLGEEALEALSVAAVVGRRFRFDVLARALEWPEERLLRALEPLIERGLLVEEEGRAEEAYTFRHSLVQEVLYTRAIGRRRRIWHRRVAAALEESGAGEALPHTMLAFHYRQGGDPQRARVHAILAGDEAARLCAWQDAERMYEQALAAVEQEAPDPALEAAILEKMADVAWWQNRIPALEQYAEDALELRRELGDRAGQAALLRRLANVYAYQHGRMERAVSALQEALVLVEDGQREAVFVMNDLGRLHLARRDFAGAETWLGRALESGAARGDGEESLSLALLGELAIERGDIEAGVARLELARALLREQALDPQRAAAVFHSGIRALEAAREHERARGWLADAIAYAERQDAVADHAIYRAYLAAVDRRAGRWSGALEIAAEAVQSLRAADRAELRDALRILGDLHRVRGEAAPARAAYEEALRLGNADADVALGALLLSEGRFQDAATRLRAQLAERSAEDRLFRLRVLPLLVEAEAQAGAADAARAALEELAAAVEASDYRAGTAALAQAEGFVRAVEGDAGRAAARLREALDGWRALGLPYEAERARLTLAEQVLRDGENREEGLRLLRESADALDALGAAAEAARARELLRSAGVRVRPGGDRVPEPLDRLTEREREVLRELAKGVTNKQIARALSIKPKTVSNHVTSILAKLGCSNRTEASRVALEARYGVVNGSANSAANGDGRRTA